MPEWLKGLPTAFAASGTVWLTLGLATAWLLRRRPARAHSVLTLTAVAALAMPLLVVLVEQANWGVLPAATAPFLAAARQPTDPATAAAAAATTADSPSERHSDSARPPLLPVAGSPRIRPTPPGLERPWWTAALALWLTVSAALIVRLLVDVAAGWRTVQRSLPTADAALAQALCNALERIGGAQRSQSQPRLRTSQAVASPALWGWSRPATILIPDSAPLPGDGEAVFCHELAHLQRRDHWTALLAEWLVCILPWHPLAWATRRWMDEFSEEACDDWAVACGCPPVDYAATLVRLTPTATPALTMAAVSRRSPLATRVRRLLAGGFQPPRLGRGWIAGATFGTLILAATWALWQPRHAEAESTKGAPPTKDHAPPTETKRLRVVVLDPNGKPIPDATIRASIRTEATEGQTMREAKTNTAGAAEVELPKTVTRLRLLAEKPTFVSMVASWDQYELASGHDVPTESTFRLEPAVTAGGQIQDEQGRPIPGAQVQVILGDMLRPAKGDDRISYAIVLTDRDHPITTDAEGRWRIDNVPDHPQLELRLLVSHPDYAPYGYWQEGQKKAAGVTTAMLRQGTATLTLKSGVIVRGQVTDPAGKPIQNAFIAYDNDSGASVTTDAEGRFRLPAQAVGERTLTVIAPGWAPQMRPVNLETELPPQSFRMEPGKPIRLSIVDSAGKAIPDASVKFVEWNGKTSLLNSDAPHGHDTKIPRRADGDGRWEWTWAPNEPVQLRIASQGYTTLQLEIGGGEAPRTVVLKPELRITGRVTDAVTGKPIPVFRVYPINFLTIAERYHSVAGREGRLNYSEASPDAPFSLRVEAEGYLTQDGPEFRVGGDTALSQDFRLRPSPPITGKVLDTHGRPIANLEVLLATPTQVADLSAFDTNYTAMTDASGKFAFPDPGEPWAVIAQNDSGYASAEFTAGEHDAGALRLYPWASVRGQFRERNRPVPGVRINLALDRLNGPGRPRIDGGLGTVTDADGRFEFPRVPPVSVNVKSYIKAERGTTYHPGASRLLDLQPGQRADVWTSEVTERP
ncbi:Signal transducer regulating beta-lactamase production, contains metallopeptidase domain [Singulisphaera sp. GP187]|uniref:carboxypeptidase regulatory-like domain-containing protein n=1 Tax=Singulisphaera sp. GP187 TaxID=1882752 RepID=UPI00092B7B23|nr:carboxypeptidase regulatory-like domain-containing protein [Singulisphaera sp. GP187]SIO41187.1 Signal transducer regulating beta-lactamase production, contains metallopeptidase domain [Singulisphaera sp. GP187]